MNGNENPTPEMNPTPPAATETEAAPAAIPLPHKKESAYRLFLCPNLFRLAAVLLMIVGLAISVFQPVFTVKVEYDDHDGLMDAFDAPKEASFSLYDLATDLKGEIDLHNEYLDTAKKLKEMNLGQDLLDKLKYNYSAPENSGKFSAAMTTFITNLRLGELEEYEQKTEEYLKKVAKGDTSAHMPSAPQPGQNRFNTFFFYLFIFIIPVFLVVIFAINVLIRLIQMLILFIRPSPYPKKADASSMLMLPIGLGCTIAAMHFLASGFVLDLYALIPLCVVCMIAIVCDIVYRSATKRIVMKKLDL